ncbi:MAG: putative polysaccharide biosynthesis protein [Bacillota bacterium]|uniref:Oligosaccharide flippase family protein n=1 Tax=Thermanaerosceptrum fracticalcis TaxID=1712410 RepID=A0A7G6E137_THEFR|nr:polysaccharide biosynthesis protein [Thermanaerosceptrum fracticalcis]QNB45791.1 oligosaccharide flippase family protein [Thermanaerosceptrum fracticalcis]
MAKHSFLKGAFILVMANGLVKIIGFIYQIIIVRIIGTEGVGVFNMVFPLYITAMVITNAGIPLAVSKSVAETNNEKESQKILGMALTLLILLSTGGSFLLILFSPFIISKLYADPRVIPCFLVLISSLLLVAVSSGFRGYFQGTQDMRPTALTQLVEQVVRFITGLSLVIILVPYGLTWAAVGLAGGIFLSEIAGLVYIWHRYRRNVDVSRLIVWPSLKVLHKLFSFGIPVTITRLVITLCMAVEASLIPQQLMKSGFSLSRATSFYGELTGIVFTLISIPSILTFSLATTLVPAIAEAQSRKQANFLSQRTADAIGITLLAGVPSILVLFFWGPALSALLFNVTQAGVLLKIMSCGCIFLYLSQTMSGMLQGLGYVKIIFLTTLLGGLIRISGIYYFGAQPDMAETAIALSYILSYVITCFINLCVVKNKTKFTLNHTLYVRLFLSSMILIFLLFTFAPMIEQNLMVLLTLSFLFTGIFYLVMFLTGDKYIRLIIEQVKQNIIKKPV